MARSTASLRSSLTLSSFAWAPLALNAWLALPDQSASVRRATSSAPSCPARRVPAPGPARRRLAAWTGTASDVLTGDWRVASRRTLGGSPPSGTSSSRRSRPGGAAPSCGSRRPAGMHVVHLEDRRGRHRAFPLGRASSSTARRSARTAPAAAPRRSPRPGGGSRAPRPGRARCTTRAPRWRRPAGSTSRAATTPSWSRRSGVTTCASRASSSRCWTASTTCPRRSPSSVPARVAGSASSSTTSSPGPRRPRSSTRSGHCRGPPHVRSSGHPYVDVWQSVRPARARAGRVAGRPPRQTGSTAICAELGWPHDSQADIARAWKRILGACAATPTSSRACSASVEELIDFVTAPETP